MLCQSMPPPTSSPALSWQSLALLASSRLLSLLDCIDNPRVSYPLAFCYVTFNEAKLLRVVPDEECGRSQAAGGLAPATKPETDDLWCPTHHPTPSVVISSCGSTVPTRSSTEDEEENIESLGVTDLLRGIGTSFEEGVTENAAQAFGQYSVQSPTAAAN